MDRELTTAGSTQQNRRQAAFRLAAILVSTTFALLTAEIGLRCGGYSPSYINATGGFHEADPVSGHRGKRNFSARHRNNQFDVQVVHNEQGFRRQEYQNPRESTDQRICVFGDSFVWGWGVAQGEVFTDRLSQQCPNWRVENFGINASGTVGQYELFVAECLPSLRAGDTVLLNFFSNDFSDNLEGTRPAVVRNGEVVTLPADTTIGTGWKRTMQESSYLFNFLSYAANRWQSERRIARAQRNAVVLAAAAEEAAKRKNDQAAQRNTDSNVKQASYEELDSAEALSEVTPQITVARHFLARWKEDCERRGARFIVAYIPGVVELDEGGNAAMAEQDRAFRRSFRACTEPLEIETLDLLPLMLAAKRRDGIQQVLIPADGHWNAAGHQMVAGILEAQLRHPRQLPE